MFQVTQRLSSAVKNGIHEIRLVLKPESLGDMRMTIQIEGDVVMAKINVESQQVKQIVENNLQALKDALEEQNLQAGAFDVNVNQGNSENDESSSESGSHNAETMGPEEEGAFSSNLTVGTETGRRFGSNSIEFFA